MTYDELHQLRRHPGRATGDSKAALKKWLSALDALDRKRLRDVQDDLPAVAGERNRIDWLHLAFALDKEVVAGDSRRRNRSYEMFAFGSGREGDISVGG